MKKNLFFIALLIFTNSGNAQITIDNVYPGAKQQLYMVNLEISGMKYVVKNDAPSSRSLTFYNLNHSLWKTINCNAMPTATYVSPGPGGTGTMVSTIYAYDAVAISQRVFDCDSLIEFMYVCLGPNSWFTGIYNENGVAKLVADSMAPLCKLNIPNQYKPLYNTPGGGRLILSHISGKAVVYNLPCTITNTEVINGISSIGGSDEAGLTVYPNPSLDEISTINYQLPTGVAKGQILVYDMLGKETRRFDVDNNFSSLVLSPGDLPSGTYLYSLIAGGNVIETKKVIINAD